MRTDMEEGECNLNADSKMIPKSNDNESFNDNSASKETDSIRILQPALFVNKTLLELSKAEWSNRISAHNPEVQPYLRGCSWSPDGTCCLAVVNGGGVHVVELPRGLYDGAPTSCRAVDPLVSTLHVPESGLVYDFCWYPAMNSALPETCCWLTSRRHGPVQLWDAFDGGLRCSYRGFDAVDEMEPALSLAFAPPGDLIYAGYKKCLRTFHTCRPGRDCGTHSLKAPAACLASAGRLLAVGSWNASLTLYSVSEMGTFRSVGKMHGHSGGVTHARFSPDGTKLVTGARKDPRLLVFDLRRPGRPLRALTRRAATNQRVTFDVSPCGRYLATGGTDGSLRVWDEAAWGSGGLDDEPTYTFPLHDDCLNSVSIHPHRPIIATGSGQYHSHDPIVSLHDNTEGDTDESVFTDGCNNKSRTIYDATKESTSAMELPQARSDIIVESDKSMDVFETGEVKSENSLVFWWIGEVSDL